MLFVRHATTAGMRAACFPDDGDEADSASLTRAAATLGGLLSERHRAPGPLTERAGGVAVDSRLVFTAPARAARQTAIALGCPEPRVCVALGEADCGRWRGLPYERVAREEPEALANWPADPRSAPHGGESPAAHAARVAAWLDSLRGGALRDGPGWRETHDGRGAYQTQEVVAVCDVGTIRAALGHALRLDPPAAARFDLAPLSTTELTATRDGWRVAHVNRKV
ncbi:histidine phosphatase family protein [Nonomuraea sp. NPDC050404]|uniref:histidine phosphatase family protein n=1 Tax=Nonomuraea sp. NPDC050404 TaxID=3155783 RepID=UPI0033E5C692